MEQLIKLAIEDSESESNKKRKRRKGDALHCCGFSG
jgi:hypothetical protein